MVRDWNLELAVEAAGVVFAAVAADRNLSLADEPPAVRDWLQPRAFRVFFRSEDSAAGALRTVQAEVPKSSKEGRTLVVMNASFAVIAAMVVAVGVDQVEGLVVGPAGTGEPTNGV